MQEPPSDQLAIRVAERGDLSAVLKLYPHLNPATLKFYRDVGFEQNKTGFQIRQIPVRAG